jgi:hypothetical protein
MALWKNLPDTTTPLNAENLSRSERYLTATAGANGDFYVNIAGASGLAANDIVRISFPAATVSTANARLSIDNGTTYINCRMGAVNLTADELENQVVTMVYNGTYWGFSGSIGGSNSNGFWQKSSDGTLQCYGFPGSLSATQATGNVFRSSSSVTWTYPKAFSTIYAVLVNINNNDGWGTASSVGNTTSLIWRLSTTSQAGTLATRCTAIGRWF